jgi:hypothetical protein
MTTQRCDQIIIKGIQYNLKTLPLDDYWTDENPKPSLPVIRSSNWRGYIATWEIKSDCLYLLDIEIYTPEPTKGLNYVFPHMKGKIKASWYTGELSIPQGQLIEHFNDGFNQVFESDWLIEIDKGNVVSQRYQANY